ncbi:MAG: AMP-binding protein [Nitrospinae bacterium]|nr:AMP-binding protein [Nitrospinota bacterium]
MSESVNLPPYFRPPLEYPDYAFHGLLKTACARRPDAIALVDGEVRMSFRELDVLSNACARAMLAEGIGIGDRVGLFLPNSAEFEIAAFGASKIGAVFTPMNPAYKETEAAYQLSDSGAKILITTAEGAAVVREMRKDLPALEAIIVMDEDGGNIRFNDWIGAHPAENLPEPEIALPYSSGTTGLPKGVMLTHRNLVSNYHQCVANHHITDRDSGLLFLPLYHIYGALIMGSLILAGATHVLMNRFTVPDALRLVQEHKLTLFFGVPPALLAIAHYENLGDYDLSSLRYIMSGAAPLPAEVRRIVQEKTGVLTFMGYGLTEASPLTHLNPPVQALIQEESVGPPVSDQEQKIVDVETGTKELPVGEAGELIIKGPHIMKGYWNAPEATAEALRDGWLHTGDIGRVDEQGYVYLMDRKKEMIKYKGFSVAPAELEACLHLHPDVADAAVVPREDPAAGEIPMAFVVPKEGVQIDEEALMEFVNEKVAGYKQIRAVAFIDAIPKSGSGKILRRLLKEKT